MTIEILTTRLDKASAAFAALGKTVESLTARLAKCESNERVLKGQLATLKTAIANAKNENRSNDAFFVGLEFCRERDGDTTLTYDPKELREIGKRLIAERNGAKAPNAPDADFSDDDGELPF